MTRATAVLVALAVAVHVAVPALMLPAPVPVLLAFAAVLGVLGWAIFTTAVRDGFRIEPVTYWRKA